MKRILKSCAEFSFQPYKLPLNEKARHYGWILCLHITELINIHKIAIWRCIRLKAPFQISLSDRDNSWRLSPPTSCKGICGCNFKSFEMWSLLKDTVFIFVWKLMCHLQSSTILLLLVILIVKSSCLNM
ncbi:Hypothetical predicted protein [Podarcis lilfordi]|uniref:Uncharacterized protein n=1 Tax=Podarcis lilfordi TaxID=74358 RepID=A0AA35L334_9SAUR|nr:Hypothetical predicted protein [Podarcis lilfordi]